MIDPSPWRKAGRRQTIYHRNETIGSSASAGGIAAAGGAQA